MPRCTRPDAAITFLMAGFFFMEPGVSNGRHGVGSFNEYPAVRDSREDESRSHPQPHPSFPTFCCPFFFPCISLLPFCPFSFRISPAFYLFIIYRFLIIIFLIARWEENEPVHGLKVLCQLAFKMWSLLSSRCKRWHIFANASILGPYIMTEY